MTRKDYNLIAGVLKSHLNELDYKNESKEALEAKKIENDLLLSLSQTLADKLEEDNKSFNRIIFLRSIFNI